MKKRQRYQPMPTSTDVTRREFVKHRRHHRGRRRYRAGRACVRGRPGPHASPGARDQHQRLHEGPEGQACAARGVPRAGRRSEGPALPRGRQDRREGRGRDVRAGRPHADGQGHEGELRPLLRARRRRRPQGQPRRPAAHQHPRRTHTGGRDVAPRQQGAAGSHRHLGPLRLHAEGRRLHAGPVPEGRPDRRPADDGRDREHVEGRERRPTSASTTSTRTSTTSRRASWARASRATRTTSST